MHSPCSTSDQGRVSDQHVGKLSTLAEDGTLSERTLQKRRLKAQRNLANEFVSALGVRIAALESTLASGTAAEKEAARARRKQLREVQKVAGDPALAVEERLKALQGALLQQAADAAKGDRAVLELRAQLEATTKERDRARAELQTSNALRRKLEDLCRSLQRESKEAVEASSRRSDEDRAVQQAMQARLNSSLEELQVKIRAQETTLIADNASLRETLEKHVQQAALEAERNAQALKMKDLEVQLAQAQLKQKELVQQEVEARCAAQLHAVAEERRSLLETNSALQEQLNTYRDKFTGFEKTLHDSQKMYDTWKAQLEAQQKQVKLVLQERNAARNEKLRVEKAAADERRKLSAQVETLQRLCRALQAKLKSGPAGQDTLAAADGPAAMASDDQRSELDLAKDAASMPHASENHTTPEATPGPATCISIAAGEVPVAATAGHGRADLESGDASTEGTAAAAATNEPDEGSADAQEASTAQPASLDSSPASSGGSFGAGYSEHVTEEQTTETVQSSA